MFSPFKTLNVNTFCKIFLWTCLTTTLYALEAHITLGVTSTCCLNLQICFSISGFTTSVRIYHVEARIAQCLYSRLCVLGILVWFLTGSRESFFSKTFIPALGPTNLPTQRERGGGGGLSQSQNSQNVKHKIILLRLSYNGPNQA